MGLNWSHMKIDYISINFSSYFLDCSFIMVFRASFRNIIRIFDVMVLAEVLYCQPKQRQKLTKSSPIFPITIGFYGREDAQKQRKPMMSNRGENHQKKPNRAPKLRLWQLRSWKISAVATLGSDCQLIASLPAVMIFFAPYMRYPKSPTFQCMLTVGTWYKRD